MSDFLPLAPGSTRLRGRPDEAIRWIAEHQLKNRDAWRHFVEAFRTGIDSGDAGWRGEYWGKMMRGACMAQAYLQDPELGAVLHDAVAALLDAQDALGRISSYRPDAEFRGWDIWCRKYVITGLLHYVDLCLDESLNDRILAALRRHADYIVEHVGNGPGQIPIAKTSTAWLGVNSCSILEPFVRLHEHTGERRYLDFAKSMIDCGGCDAVASLIDLALEGRLAPFEYPETKAYETMSFFEGVLAYAECVGDERLLRAACAFAEAVARTDITVIGCAGCTHELFDHSAEKQTEPSEIIMQETCVTVTWMRLCTRLLRATGNPVWSDQIERSAWNALYGAMNTRDQPVWSKEIQDWVPGMPVDSYSPLYANRRGRAMGGYKRFPDGFAYGCCVCIFSAGVALVGRTSAFAIESQVAGLPCEGIAVNSLVAGTVSATTPRSQPLLLEIEGGYPLEGRAKIRVSLARPEVFRIVVRVPDCGRDPRMSVGGETNPVAAGFTVFDREWRNGDEIEVDFGLPLEELRLNGRVAFRKGPIVLARDALKDAAFAPDAGDLTAPIALARALDGAPVVSRSLPPEDGELLRLALRRADGSELLLTDYASCGKLWSDPKALISVWLNP